MEKNLKLEIGNRLRDFLEKNYLTQAEFARTVGFTTGYINDIIRGRTKPSITLLRKMRDIYAVPIDWVLAGGCSPISDAERAVILVGKDEESKKTTHYVAVPMLRNLKNRVVRGKQVVVKDFHPHYCCIVPRHWVKDTENTFCTLMKDKSMEPTIPKGSHAGINCTIKKPEQMKGKLCAVRNGEGRLLIRRLKLTNTHLLFEPDNPAAKEKTLCIRVDEENPIIGKVEWAWSLLK